MPDPDPQPPQPHPISAARWLLILLPSALAIIVPLNLGTTIRHLSYKSEATLYVIILVAAMVLCYALGFLLEKWLWGTVKNFDRALRYGALILTMNFFVWAATVALSLPKLR